MRKDIISSAYLKDPTDPQWKDDARHEGFDAFLDKYYPEGDRADASVMYGYTVAQTMVYVLKNCGDDLTRANIMKQAASIKDLKLGGLLPGHQGQHQRHRFRPDLAAAAEKLKGKTWERFGDIIRVRWRRRGRSA